MLQTRMQQKWIKIFTFLGREEIQLLTETHQKNPAGREIQKALAKAITIFIHGESEYQQALITTEKLFRQSTDIENLSEADLHALEGLVKSAYPLAELRQGVDVVQFLAESGILPSKGEARKMVQNGGISINRMKVESIQFNVDTELLLHNKYLLVQKGKKNFYLIEVS